MMANYVSAVLIATVSITCVQAAQFYVSPRGSDAATGTKERPFATLERARDAAREVDGPVSVFLYGGLYELPAPLQLSPEDSGLSVSAVGDSIPILSGGHLITGWEPVGKGLWKVNLPDVASGEWNFHQLFIRKPGQMTFERRYRPSRGLFVVTGLTDAPHKYNGPINHRNPQDEFYFHEGDITAFENLDDVELVAMHDWSSGRLHIREIDFKENIVKLKSFPHYRIGHWYEGGRNPYLLENIKEDLGKPGQWYLDRPSGDLFYVPLAGEDMNVCEVVVPRLEHLITVTGHKEKPDYAENIVFRGITFAHSAWLKAPHKYAEDFKRSCRQGFVDMPSAVELKWSRRCCFSDCDFLNLGSHALDFGVGCHENTVEGSRFLGLGGGGIKVGTVNRAATFPEVPTGNTIANNVIRNIGLVHYSAHGIWGGICAKTDISHNDVSRTLYSSIAVGWSHNKNEGACRDNIIAWNHVHDVLLLLDHGGAVYTLGNQPGTVICGNHIHQTYWTKLHGKFKRPDWAGGGLAFDDGSSGFIVEKNILYDIAPPTHRALEGGRSEDMTNIRDNVCDIHPGEPGFPDDIAEKAGLEPRYRHLLEKPFNVPAPPVLAMCVPDDVGPGPIRDTFDRIKVGQQPRLAYRRLEDKEPGKGTDTVEVTDETAADGKHSLKIVDAPNLSREWLPYVSYSPKYDGGKATVEFALRIEARTKLECAWRGPHPKKGFSVGPQFLIEQGKLTAGTHPPIELPLNEWIRFRVSAKLGKLDPGIGNAGNLEHGVWNLVVTLPDGNRLETNRLPFTDPEFEELNQVMFISLADEKTVVYLDSVNIRNE